MHNIMEARLNLSSLKDKITAKLTNNSIKQKKANELKSNNKKSREKAEIEDPEDELLRREALSLGANAEDLDLLKNLNDSDSEQEFGDVLEKDETLNEELNNFIKEIGLESKVDIVEDIPELVDDAFSEDSDASAKDVEEDSETEQLEQNIDSDSDSNVDKIADTDKITNFSAVDNSKLKVPGRLDWYNNSLPPFTGEKLDKFAIDRLYEKASQIINTENQTYLEEFAANNSQKKFLSQILKDGTLNDKISALTLLIQESPLHNIKAMDTLLNFCEKKSRTAALQAINAYKDLLVNGLLPDRKLLAFSKRPLSKSLSDIHLASFYFEDYLKKSYFKFIQVLEHLLHDPIVHVKMNVVGDIFDLLKAKPEQEANLLNLGVNKLGDVENKVAGKTSFQLLQLQQAHPAMKATVVNIVVDVVLRPNVEHHAQYYGVLTLNQTILTRNDVELANNLVTCYFSLFQKILIVNNALILDVQDNVVGKTQMGRKNNRKNFKKGKYGGKSVKQPVRSEAEVIEEKNSKLFSAVLTGLNRAFPFADLANDVYETHLDTLFRITHSSNFNTSVQALMLIHHIITKQKLSTDRFFRTLYESLLDPRLLNSSKQGIYLNLLFKALKSDTTIPRVLAFVKRILQVCNHWLTIGTISGMLFLLAELSKTIPEIRDLTIDINSRPDSDGIMVDTEYDSKKRDPKYANAEKSSLWEINQFLNHYHPTVSIYAQSLLSGDPQTKPDLGLFTLSHFLDRFVYRNSKDKPASKGTSIMQPLGGAHTGALLVKATNLSHQGAVNTEDWLAKRAEDIKPDEQFFHQYFTTKASKIKGKKTETSGNIGNVDDSANSDISDDDVWDALVKSKPEVEADSDDSIGFDEDDFADDFEDDFEDDIVDSDISSSDEPIFDEEVGDEYKSDDLEFRKRKNENSESASKKRKFQDLPVFAAVDEYSQYLSSDED